jgi:hypothetical protein
MASSAPVRKGIYMIRHILVAILVSLCIPCSVQVVCAQQPPYGASDGNPAAGRNPAQDGHVQEWFSQYDNIRRQSQMNPDEKARADRLLAGGMAMLVPGPEKIATGQLLAKLRASNQQAANQLKGLRLYPETKQLHLGYYKYFNDAQSLFADYISLQNNLFATDASGKSIASQLMQRKQALADLDQSNKMIDSQLRAQYGIAPYRY